MKAKKMETETPALRLKTARKRLRMSQAEMASRVGVPRSTLTEYEQGKYEIPRQVCIALEYKLGINQVWLLSGEGDMFLQVAPRPGRSAGEGISVAELVTRPIVITDKSELEHLNALEGRDRFYAVPYLRDAAAAGTGRVVEDEIEGYCIIHERVAPRPENLRCVRISGESMAPVLPDSSIIAVDITLNNPRLVDGKIVCARVSEEEVVIKRLRLQDHYLILLSENQDQDKYPPVVLDLNERKDLIIGQVVWAWVDLK